MGNEPGKFSLGEFSITYGILLFLFLLISPAIMDIYGCFLGILGLVVPIPFFLLGYYAQKIRFSVVIALLIFIMGIGVFMFMLPSLDDTVMKWIKGS